MDYRDAVLRGMEYIEAHVGEELSPGDIAAQAGYSVYHYSRAFAACRGVPLMDYVRQRRLARAGGEIAAGRGVLAAALDYGFESASGFARAFRREFGITPTGCRADAGDDERGVIHPMNVRFETRGAFNVAGYGIATDVTSGYTRDIAAYWEQYEGESMECRMYAKLRPPRHGEVGICVPDGECGRARYLLGVIVPDLALVEPDMIAVTVPAARYAVFTTPPVDSCPGESPDPLAQAMKAGWRYVFGTWFAAGGYEYDESALDFEFYDERCHGERGLVAEIWVPVREVR